MMGRWAVGAAVAVVLAACANPAINQPWSPGNPSQPWGSDAITDSVHIEVTNHNFADARLIAISDGQRRGLGTVIGKQNGRFTIPWDFHQELQIEIRLMPGPTCMTERLPVDPGDILDLEITPVLFRNANCY